MAIIIGDKIRDIRKFKKLSQAEFGNILGFTQGFISSVENNDKSPGAEFFISLKKCFNVNMNWLFSNEGDMFQETIDEDLEKIIKTIKENTTAKKMVLRLIDD